MTGDVNAIMRAYLGTALIGEAWVGRIYSPRLREGSALPALAFFVRGGDATPYIPHLVEPSFQFDCWGSTPQEARSVYTALYDVLQGVENQSVTVDGRVYVWKSAIEEVQAQDIQSVDPMDYHRVLAFFKAMIQTEEV